MAKFIPTGEPNHRFQWLIFSLFINVMFLFVICRASASSVESVDRSVGARLSASHETSMVWSTRVATNR